MDLRTMLTRGVYVAFVAVLLVSTIISLVLQLLSLEEGAYEKAQYRNPNLPSEQNDTLIIGDKYEHIFPFLQISDIHLSVHFDPDRRVDLERFCNEIVDTIKPRVVIASGDLTDSRTRGPMGSRQYEQEWKWYAEVLKNTSVTKKTAWLDLRGNHDNFDIYSWDSYNNYYRTYSHIGKLHPRHYAYNFTDGNDRYSFVAADACVSPSPKRPYNFVGVLTSQDIQRLQEIRDETVRIGSNFTVWFGHYPTSSIVMPHYNIRHLINGPYLCGHFHTLSNLVKEMYSTHQEGSLELEVGDWKDNRIYRVAAIDHGLFSFVDTKLDQWPAILITNPKPALFSMPGYEPLHRIRNSTHIRVLIFSPYRLLLAQFRIDNSTNWINLTQVGDTNLFVHQWQPSLYEAGLHTLQVRASDSDNNEEIVTSKFSFDGSREDFAFGARFLLRISTRSFGVCLYLIGLAIALSPLMIAFYLVHLEKGALVKSKAKFSFIYKNLFKLYLLGALKRFSVPLFLIPIYLFVGPWYVGHLLHDHIGLGFVWGLMVNWTVLPTALTYVWGLIIILLFHLPITLNLAHIIYCNYIRLESGQVPTTFITKYIHLRHILFFFIVLCNSLISYSFVHAYGYLTVVFGFGITWLLVVYVLLWKLTFGLTHIHFPEQIRPKYNKPTDATLKSADQVSYKSLLDNEFITS